MGFYANQYPQSATNPPREDYPPGLEGQEISTLVVKGRYDYPSCPSAAEYPRALPEARLLYLRGSGHNAYLDQPERYVAGGAPC